ncbi:hypothetical protein [Roseibium aggregatum]|uniref:Uncharacterized protein n=1 Tax=Roseibium aggregatum TaxID=187304 RepID=A0A926S4Z2_9HYPH|nr:hypothetical protein [Roseibium aggregatum]MBD1545916.1 hypothetical protein [Roseibium aggregatum]
MAEPTVPSAQVLCQISALPKSDRPLIVCDVDEVILHMAGHFTEFLAAKNLTFLSGGYRFTGNIAPIGSNTPISQEAVRQLVDSFFDEESHRQKLVEGADTALKDLHSDWDIVLLTNMPGPHNKPVREKLLQDFGVPYPLLTNSGAKGGAVAALAAGRPVPLVFIDDSPMNHVSVNASLPSAVQIQFVADKDFRAAVKPSVHIDLLTGDWTRTRDFIGGILSKV